MTDTYDIEHHKRALRNFLERDNNSVSYLDRLKQTISDGVNRLVVDINDMRDFDTDLAQRLLRQPREYMLALQEVIAELVPTLDPSLAKIAQQNAVQVGFDGCFGANSVSPRGLMSSLLNRLVEVEGIVTKCSNVRPKLVKSVQYCPATEEYSTRDFRDQTTLNVGMEIRGSKNLPTTASLPTVNKDGERLELEHGLCQYKDYQCITLQEMPERAKVGQLPRSVEVILEYDLVDVVKPGDRVQCVGIYRPLSGGAENQTNAISSVFKSVLLCNNVKVIGKEIGGIQLTGADVGNIRQLSHRHDILQVLSKSLCPSIFGHDYIKTALILQLLGGTEHNLDNGIHLRGDINIMMVGDPSTAKSQLLRTILDVAPLAISTSGRGSSGVGLTAAVTTDTETGERKLEAGAMVLADRGIVCIDEFDKMSEADRVAIHEVMEQQTVTIAKAGIHASLNARCSVLAAANPIYGQYDRNRRPQENIGLPDSLLSRFDLLFIVLDQFDNSFDRMLSEHVIKSHQYRRSGTTCEPEPLVQSTSSLRLDARPNSDQSALDQSSTVWQRGGAREYVATENENAFGSVSDVLTKDFMRKYIHYARSRSPPSLSDPAMEHISNAYVNMRAQVAQQSRGNLPVTARSLETLIRLSSAHAKVRLSNVVELVDVDAALVLINFVMFHEMSGNTDSTEKDVKRMAPELNEHNKRVRLDTLLSGSQADPTPVVEETVEVSASSVDEDMLSQDVTINTEYIARLIQSMGDNGDSSVSIADVESRIFADKNIATPVGVSSPVLESVREQVLYALNELGEQNKIMLSGDDIYIL